MSWISETPWWLPCGLALAGLVLFVSFKNRPHSKERLIGVGLVALAILVALLSYFLESDREAVERRTKELIAAVVKADPARMATYMDPQVTVGGLKGREEICGAAKAAADTIGLESAGATAMNVKVNRPEEAIVFMTVAAGTKNGPGSMSWRLVWTKEKGQWVMVDATSDDARIDANAFSRFLKLK